MALLGHAKLDTTAIYTQVATKIIRKVTSPLEHLIDKQRHDDKLRKQAKPSNQAKPSPAGTFGRSHTRGSKP